MSVFSEEKIKDQRTFADTSELRSSETPSPYTHPTDASNYHEAVSRKARGVTIHTLRGSANISDKPKTYVWVVIVFDKSRKCNSRYTIT